MRSFRRFGNRDNAGCPEAYVRGWVGSDSPDRGTESRAAGGHGACHRVGYEALGPECLSRLSSVFWGLP